MSAPKIIGAWRSVGGVRLLNGEGYALSFGRHENADELAALSGQRIIWPEGYGVATIEDVPPTPPTAVEILTALRAASRGGYTSVYGLNETLNRAIAAIREGRAQ